MNKQCTAGLLKKLCFLAACFLAAMFAFTGLVKAADASSISIHFIIRNDVNNETDAWKDTLVDEWVEVTEGMTGYDAFVQAMKQEGLEGKFTAEDSGYGHFVSEINGLDTPSNYSVFYGLYVNGATSDFGIDEISMADGDIVSFVYGPWSSTDEKSGSGSQKTADVADMYDTVIAATTGDLSDNLVFGNEWHVFIAARAGVISDADAETYYNNLAAAVKEGASEKLDERYTTTNSRVILALSSIKKDATDVEGYNLLLPLADLDAIKAQGVNAAAYALLALDSNNYEIPETTSGTQSTRENIIDYILSSATEDGGYSYGGQVADPDVTGMVIAALAPYYNTDEKVKEAVDKAVEVLSGIQNEDGSYSSWGAANSDSTAWVITALSTLGINPDEDSRFKKNGRTPVDALADYFVPGEGFTYMSGDSQTSMYSNNDVAYALIAFNRLNAGDRTLFDMAWTDEEAEEEPEQETTDDTVVPAAGTATSDSASGAAKTGDNGMLPVAMLAVISLAGAVILKKKSAEA